MPLFEVETNAHIIITWAADDASARKLVLDAYPTDDVMRLTKRPRDTWVISKAALGLTNSKVGEATIFCMVELEWIGSLALPGTTCLTAVRTMMSC